jgi:predicted AAA+ superfamily ATPase
MEKEKLKELIIQHKEGFFSKTNLTERFILENFKRFLTSREVVLITGIRRCGKSSLMKLICDDLINKYGVSKNNILYINFDDERFVDFSVKDFEILYETFLEIESPDGRKYFFLDEIQNISGWERWVNRVYEFEDVKFFITGSNSSLLSSDVSVSLTGRNRQIILFPFSFYEFLKFKKISFDEKSIFLREKKAMIKRMFKEYVDHGGFPEVLKADDKTILEQYFKDILYRDLISGYSIRNIRELKELCLYLVSNPATIHSYESLKNFIKAKNITTIKNYIEAFEEVFLFFKVSFFDFSVKR